MFNILFLDFGVICFIVAVIILLLLAYFIFRVIKNFKLGIKRQRIAPLKEDLEAGNIVDLKDEEPFFGISSSVGIGWMASDDMPIIDV